MYADNTSGHNLMRYSTSNSPYGPFKDGGVILDATSCDTTHGSIVEYKIIGICSITILIFQDVVTYDLFV